MFWKILQWVQFLISLIREAEDELGAGKGEEKKAFVLAAGRRELEELLTRDRLSGCAPGEIGSYIGAIVDGAVGLLNCLGIFKHAPAAASTPATTPKPEPRRRV